MYSDGSAGFLYNFSSSIKLKDASQVNGVNNSQIVVGQIGGNTPVFWSPGSSYYTSIALPQIALPGDPGNEGATIAFTAAAIAINNHGIIIGNYITSVETSMGGYEGPGGAFVANINDSPVVAVDLAPLIINGGGLALAYVTDINDAGQITGCGEAGDGSGFILTPTHGRVPFGPVVK